MATTLLTSPTEVAFADGSGGLVVQMPDPAVFPDPAGGGDTLWRVSPEGDVHAAYRATTVVDAVGPPRLALFGIAIVSPLSAKPSLLFEEDTRYPGGGHTEKYLWALPLDGRTEPVQVPAELPGEGCITGLGWQSAVERLLMSTASDGGDWLSAWSLDGSELPWPANPVRPEDRPLSDAWCGHCVTNLTVIPGTNLIAYVASAGLWVDFPSELVIYDTAIGQEVDRVQVADVNVGVTRLHANESTIAVTRMTAQESTGWRFEYLPVLLFDLSTQSLLELEVAGAATLAPAQATP